jgi:alkylation response protein AidB-like acyl-CoA dehydrogenase
MNLTLSDEQQDLVHVVADFLDKASPESEVRRLMDAGGEADAAVWNQMAQQLGLQGLIIPESYGGGGFGYLELALVLERMGGALLVAPFLSSVVAASALIESDDEELKATHLPALASGERIGALALAEDSGRWDVGSVQTIAESDGDHHRLNGVKSYVLDGQYADVLIVSARSPVAVGLFAVDASDPGVTVTPLQMLDATRPQARFEFSAAPARALCTTGGAALVDRVQAIAGICLAAEQVGGAQRCLDMAVGYAKVRVQFGQPIGSFQAIKHKCADMLVAVESARSAVYYAADVLDEGGDPVLASTVAQAHCSAAYTAVAGENIQIHGGIGFTWEHPAHLYFKRAKSSELLFGDPACQLERLACLIGS